MARPERKLVAVLAADVVGYSRLMGADEAGTLLHLKTLRAEVIDPPETVQKGGYLTFNGRPGYGIELNEKTLAAHKV